MRGEDRFKLSLELEHMFVSKAIGLETRILFELRSTQRIGQNTVDPVIAGGDDHVAVLGLIDLERRDRCVARAQGARNLAVRRISNDQIFHQRDLAIEHRNVDTPAFAGSAPVIKRGEHADGRVNARCDVTDRSTDTDRRLSGMPGDADDAAHRLHHEIIGRPFAQWPVLAIALDRCVDERGKPVLEVLVAEPVLLSVPGRKFSISTSACRSKRNTISRSSFIIERERDRSFASLTPAK